MKKALTAWVLATALAATLLPLTAFAADGEDIDLGLDGEEIDLFEPHDGEEITLFEPCDGENIELSAEPVRKAPATAKSVTVSAPDARAAAVRHERPARPFRVHHSTANEKHR